MERIVVQSPVLLFKEPVQVDLLVGLVGIVVSADVAVLTLVVTDVTVALHCEAIDDNFDT